MGKTLEFYFDVGSPASWLAYTQLPALCAQAGARLQYRPMLLGGVFQATGNHSPVTVPAKGRYIFGDFARFAARYGVPLVVNPHFPINTLLPMRIAAGLQGRDDPRFADFLETVFRAIWAEARDMNDAATVAATLQAAGFDPQALLALANDAGTKELLKAQTAEAVARGVFGAPTFFVDGAMFWGQDRLDFVREALA